MPELLYGNFVRSRIKHVKHAAQCLVWSNYSLVVGVGMILMMMMMIITMLPPVVFPLRECEKTTSSGGSRGVRYQLFNDNNIILSTRFSSKVT